MRMRLSLFGAGLAAFVLMVLVNTSVVKAEDPSCFKRCGCGDTLNGGCTEVRRCNGGAEPCMLCTCSKHKYGPDCPTGGIDDQHNWNDECGSVPYCELQGTWNCSPLGGG